MFLIKDTVLVPATREHKGGKNKELNSNNTFLYQDHSQTDWTLRKKWPYSELFWSSFSPHFLAFELNTERYSVSGMGGTKKFACSKKDLLQIYSETYYKKKKAKSSVQTIDRRANQITYIANQIYTTPKTKSYPGNLLVSCG